MNTFGEFGAEHSLDAYKIMHAQLETDSGFTLMASDTAAEMERTPGDNIFALVHGDPLSDPRALWRVWRTSW